MNLRRSPWPLVAAIGTTLVIGITALATADSRRPPEQAAPAKPAPVGSYVAIGDSFTAGGPIGAPQPATGNCMRSTINYPSIVARELNYQLTDASCIGATTTAVIEGTAALPAQVASLTKDADLVTVSVGGNDVRFFADAFVTCFRTSRPTSRGAPCRVQADQSIATKAPEVTRRVGAVLDEVRRRAPGAHIVAINYPRLMPAGGTCAATPFAKLDVMWLAQVEKAMSDTIADAADQRDIDVLDMYEHSEGHDLCSGAEAWVNGARPKPRNGLLFHPNAAGERAIAVALVNELRDRED